MCTVLSRPDTLRHWYQGTSCSLSGGLVPHKDFSFSIFYSNDIFNIKLAGANFIILYNREIVNVEYIEKQLGNLS